MRNIITPLVVAMVMIMVAPVGAQEITPDDLLGKQLAFEGQKSNGQPVLVMETFTDVPYDYARKFFQAEAYYLWALEQNRRNRLSTGRLTLFNPYMR